MTTKKTFIALLVVIALMVGWIGRVETAPTSTQPKIATVTSEMAVIVIKTNTEVGRLNSDVQYLQNEVNNLETTVNCLEGASIVEGSVAINTCSLTNKWSNLPGALP